MVDIRQRVEEDRGLLKRIQLLIPGFSGYRKREDLRQADSILRIQVADRLKLARSRMEEVRQALTDNYQVKALEPLGRAIFEAQELEGMIRHAEQGYSGFSPAIRVEESELNILYNYDLQLLDGIGALGGQVEQLAGATDQAMPLARNLSTSLQALRTAFKRRMAYITNTEAP
ncbi:MAG: hypothetical protein HZB92_08105 [Euryarchaeota archaeon]|nr:hypothetical protein [Euryarchaeota archaeon]